MSQTLDNRAHESTEHLLMVSTIPAPESNNFATACTTLNECSTPLAIGSAYILSAQNCIFSEMLVLSIASGNHHVICSKGTFSTVSLGAYIYRPLFLLSNAFLANYCSQAMSIFYVH